MLTESEFIKIVLDKFKEINEKIDELKDDMSEQVKKLCDSIHNTQKSIDDHLLIMKTTKNLHNEENIEEELQRERKNKKFYVIMAILGIGLTIYTLVKELLNV